MIAIIETQTYSLCHVRYGVTFQELSGRVFAVGTVVYVTSALWTLPERGRQGIALCTDGAFDQTLSISESSHVVVRAVVCPPLSPLTQGVAFLASRSLPAEV